MGILSTIFSKAASAVVDSVGNAFDKNFTNKEEKDAAKIELQKEINRHLEVVESEGNKIVELQFKDVADARNREIQIVTSDKAPLLNKVIQPIIALIVIGATLIIWAMILFRHYEPKTSESMIIGSLTTLTGMVLSYYFGSSTGSATKQKQLDTMMNK